MYFCDKLILLNYWIKEKKYIGILKNCVKIIFVWIF